MCNNETTLDYLAPYLSILIVGFISLVTLIGWYIYV